MRSLLVLLFSVTVFSLGCSKQIEEFVDVDKPPTDPKTSTSNPNGMKISGGAQLGVGTQVKSRYSISYKDREMKGTQVKAKVTLSGHRPEF